MRYRFWCAPSVANSIRMEGVDRTSTYYSHQHPAPLPQQKHGTAIFWVSHKFRSRHPPRKFGQMRERNHRQKPPPRNLPCRDSLLLFIDKNHPQENRMHTFFLPRLCLVEVAPTLFPPDDSALCSSSHLLPPFCLVVEVAVHGNQRKEVPARVIFANHRLVAAFLPRRRLLLRR